MKKLLGSLVTFMLISLSLSVFSNFTDVKAAFGTSPPWVKNDSVLPGTTFEQVINLSRNETETAMKAVVSVTGDEELVKWIEIQDL